jgi:hypothetical protein
MESKNWLFGSEVIRLIVTCSFLVHVSEAGLSALDGLWFVIALLSASWTARYFRIYLPLNHLLP